MNWKLINVETEADCTMDNSGIYAIINRIVDREHNKGYSADKVKIKVDVLAERDDSPIISFVGKSEAVRKAVINWFLTHDYDWPISLEYASYIGSEIARANSNEHYTQI